MNLWENKASARKLFYELVRRSEQELYDDEFLAILGAYRESGKQDSYGNPIATNEVHLEIFSARYLMHYGAYNDALECGERAFRLSPEHLEVWKILAKCYEKANRKAEAIVFQGYMDKFYNYPIKLDIKRHQLTELLDKLSIAMGVGNYAPFLTMRMFMTEAGLVAKSSLFVGEYIPRPDKSGLEYFVGCHAERTMYHNKAWLINKVRDSEEVGKYVAGDFIFDIMRADKPCMDKQIQLTTTESIVLPVFGTEEGQTIHMEQDSFAGDTYLDKWSASYFRLDKTTKITSAKPLVLGKPIKLGHSPRRKKLVLNILLDALSYPIISDKLADCMPNTYSFFSKGIIFNQSFSVAEYTNTSLPTIETGMYPHHSRTFNDKFSHEIPHDYITLSERMQELGYHTVNIACGGDGIYTGVTRGYDILITTPYLLPQYEAIERTIRHIEAFDTDQFIFMHTMDVHPWSVASFRPSNAVQANLPLADRLTGLEGHQNSVYLPNNNLHMSDFWAGLADVDRAMGYLFNYLEENYKEHEYIVTFYSDHGVPIFDKKPHICSENQMGMAFMVRGGGKCPGMGYVNELVSAVDIYPMLAHLAGFDVGDNVDGKLPAVLGGTGRECVYSNSIFPGQTYKLAIRNKTHTMYLESIEPVNEDGTVDLAGAKIKIVERGTAERVLEDREIKELGLREYFYPLARKFVADIANNGEIFPEMKEARKEWYDAVRENSLTN